MEQLNVFGEPLPICCEDPMTGFTRSGSCETMDQDHGMHTVCAHMTDEFLAFSKAQGNDLSTPMPEYGFPGLKEVMTGVYVHQDGLKLMKQTAPQRFT